jgi:hypothetical protein
MSQLLLADPEGFRGLCVSLDGLGPAAYVGIMARLARVVVPAFRSHLRAGRPPGDDGFVAGLEKSLGCSGLGAP